MTDDVDDLIGVPWTDGGRDAASGLDCIGLMLLVLRRRGFDVPDPQARAGDVTCAPEAFRHFDTVQAPQAGDVIRVWSRTGSGSSSQHVGVMLSDGSVLNAVQGMGVCRVALRAFVRAGIVGIYRPRVEPRP